MAPATNGHSHTQSHPDTTEIGSVRFGLVPRAIDVPVGERDEQEAVEVDLEELLDDVTEICTLLENENAANNYWITFAMAYAKQGKIDLAKETIEFGLRALEKSRPKERINLYNCLCWLNFLQARDAPRVIPEGGDPTTRIKEHYLREATRILNEASRINPAYGPTALARGVLLLLRAALQQEQAAKMDLLRQATRAFDDIVRSSGKKNLIALMGRARALYSQGQYPLALQDYQQVLSGAPDFVDPDPRIGIGACFWQLGFKEDAKGAWERAKQVNPRSKIANILLGLFYLDASSKYHYQEPEFEVLYKKALVEYTQEAFKLDKNLPLACATFGTYFLSKGGSLLPKVEGLARRAIERTDVNAIASDGWFLLARKAHYEEDFAKAHEFYSKSDQARGGDESGYVPAKFGIAQCQIERGDKDGAKFRLERLLQKSKSVEAMVLLGTLLAEDVFSEHSPLTQEERAATSRRAIALFENVRSAWKDESRKLSPEQPVLLSLAQLYEVDHPEKSIQCLQQAESLDLTALGYKSGSSKANGKVDSGTEEEKAAALASLRESLAPELLNNIACFQYQSTKLGPARELFQIALSACVKGNEGSDKSEQDALVTTISYNLARTYEAEGNMDDAKKVYEGLLSRHADYTDANIRLTYINLRQHPTGEGPQAMKSLYEANSSDLEVRSLFGWYLGKAKKRSASLAEDQEQRHHKYTLQNHDKHDGYALTAMGNLYLANAREMRRESESDKEKRHKMYERAVEFFAKCLELDPRNAYAAQGIAIALIDDRKDFPGALQILLRIKETIKDASIYMNLGHVYCEMKQYARAIESYEIALKKDRAEDPQLLSCLGRAWLMRGRTEKNIDMLESALTYSQDALKLAPEQVALRFNVAFVAFQLATLIYQVPETQRNLAQLEAASKALDSAIEEFVDISKADHPPFPRADIEQRANMGRNTVRKQLDRALQSQREYEEKNAEKYRKAREHHDAEVRKKEEKKRAAAQAEEERQKAIAAERAEQAEKNRALIAAREELDQKRREEEAEEAEMRKRGIKKGSGKRKKKYDDGIIDDDDVSEVEARSSRDASSAAPAGAGSGEESARPRQKKKRKLERKTKESSGKYKSAEFVADSSEDEAGGAANGDEDEVMGDGDVEDAPRRKGTAIVEDEDDE